ncbi:hypothetical protein DFJ74DRAFT_685563 [Hyaloraphidium curvatum]|nr:hypothetical protein DFJ74DRAFT_685563 [Hyaloraphidium curvatum]
MRALRVLDWNLRGNSHPITGYFCAFLAAHGGIELLSVDFRIAGAGARAEFLPGKPAAGYHRSCGGCPSAPTFPRRTSRRCSRASSSWSRSRWGASSTPGVGRRRRGADGAPADRGARGAAFAPGARAAGGRGREAGGQESCGGARTPQEVHGADGRARPLDEGQGVRLLRAPGRARGTRARGARGALQRRGRALRKLPRPEEARDAPPAHLVVADQPRGLRRHVAEPPALFRRFRGAQAGGARVPRQGREKEQGGITAESFAGLMYEAASIVLTYEDEWSMELESKQWENFA